MNFSMQPIGMRSALATIVAVAALAGPAAATPVLQPQANAFDDAALGGCSLLGRVGRGGYANACDPDLNNDGHVNFTDLAALRSRFLTNDLEDFNSDGAVNLIDFRLLSSMYFGQPGFVSPRDPGGIPVPAPAVPALLLAGLLAWRCVRRLRA